MIWLNGALIERGEMDALSAGAMLGWGVFTTLGVRAGAPLFWDHHAARLQRDAAAARVELPFEAAQLRAGLEELIGQLQIGDGLARITGTQRGDGRWNDEKGADWSIVARATPLNLAGARVQVSPFRVASAAPLAGVKTTSYLPYLHAWQHAQSNGFDEALLLTERGWVCEGARASVFWAKAGTLYTPSLRCGGLRGVGREIVLQCQGARQGRWALPALLAADEAFLVSGATGPRPIAALSGSNQARVFPAPGELTRVIQEMWRALE